MKSKEYWAKRALQREDEAALRGTKLVEQMYDQYMKAAKEIQKNIDTFILKYGQKHGMTYNQAAAYLSKKEMQEWKKTLAEYVAEIKNASDNLQKGQLTARLDALSTNSSIRRLDALIGEIECILTGLCSDTEREAHKELGELFKDSYYKKVYDIQSRAGRINQFAHLDEKTVEDILSYPWSGANFSDRVWKNKDILAFNLRETLTSGFIQGKSRTQMAKEMSDEMGKGFSAVETLIRTESSWLHGAADQRAYDVANIERYEFMATLDNRTSKQCADLDGKDFPVSEAQVGVNYPPMHPRCRSTTIEHDPEEASDWFKSGKEMPKNMTYEEWAKANGIEIATTHNKQPELVKSKKTDAEIIEEINDSGYETLLDAYEATREKFNLNVSEASDIRKWKNTDMSTIVADYTGVSASVAKAFNDAFEQLSKKYHTFVQKIKVGDKKSFFGSNTFVTTKHLNTVMSKEITLNPFKMNDYDEVVARVKELSEKGYAVKVSPRDYDKYFAVHEFAHGMFAMNSNSYKNFVGLDTKLMNKIKKEITKVYDGYMDDIKNLKTEIDAMKKSPLMKADADPAEQFELFKKISEKQKALEQIQISRYSTQNVDEFFAEAFTQAQIGIGRSKYSDDIMKIVDKYFGRST